MDENRIPSQVPSQTDVDRIALNNMFKAIAEYGRRVRLRRLAVCDQVETTKTGGADGSVIQLMTQQPLQDGSKKGID